VAGAGHARSEIRVRFGANEQLFLLTNGIMFPEVYLPPQIRTLIPSPERVVVV
jgi:hypothetical protein